MAHSGETRTLTEPERNLLENQNSRLVSDFKANKFTNEASKHWDLFYKRNETKFFKDRHWTTREFNELILSHKEIEEEKRLLLHDDYNPVPRRVLFEIGCGVGNFIFPLLEDEEEGGKSVNYFIHACDFSPRAIDFVKSHPKHTEEQIHAFVHDVTDEGSFQGIDDSSVDIVSMVFVLSAIQPDKFTHVFQKIYKILKPGGVFIFRDYGLYDMAMLRFKPGTKIKESQYLRHDGTLTYFFSIDEMEYLCKKTGFSIRENCFVHRRTVNKKEDVDVGRIFIQGKFIKSIG